MKLYLEPIRVKLAQGKPQRITWRRKIYQVNEIASFWVAQGKWWTCEERRVYMRLVTDHGVLEIYRCNNEWMISRLFD